MSVPVEVPPGAVVLSSWVIPTLTAIGVVLLGTWLTAMYIRAGRINKAVASVPTLKSSIDGVAEKLDTLRTDHSRTREELVEIRGKVEGLGNSIDRDRIARTYRGDLPTVEFEQAVHDSNREMSVIVQAQENRLAALEHEARARMTSAGLASAERLADETIADLRSQPRTERRKAKQRNA